MSVQKDKKTGKWMCQIRVTDWKGEVHHKKKRGFNTKKEALAWEKGISGSGNGQPGHDLQGFHRTVYEGHGEAAEARNGSQ